MGGGWGRVGEGRRRPRLLLSLGQLKPSRGGKLQGGVDVGRLSGAWKGGCRSGGPRGDV